MNTFARIAGLLFSGFAVRSFSIAIALYVGYTVGSYVLGVFDTVNTTLGVALAH